MNPECSTAAFTETLHEVDPSHHITTELKHEILSHLRRKGTFSEGARAYGLNEQTLRKLEREFVKAEDDRRIVEHTLRLPMRLGLHCCRIAGKNCCLLADIDTHRALEFISFKQQQELVFRVESLFDAIERARVLEVSIPLNKGFRAVTQDLFSRAQIFVPRNEIEIVTNEHLIALVRNLGLKKSKAIDVVDALCGKRLTQMQQRKLRQLFEANPALKQSHEQKQMFLEAYALNNSDEKLRRFLAWRDGFTKSSKRKDRVELLSEQEWRQAIIDGMHGSYTDYFKRIQTFIVELIRVGRGYSFETIRGRVLYGDGLPAALPIKARAKRDEQPTLFEDRARVEAQGSSIERLIDLFSNWAVAIPPQTTKKFNH